MSYCHICHSIPCICNENSSSQPPIHPQDLFGLPFKCREGIDTPRFSSPNSPLSQEELDELQACIERANHILRSLVPDRDPNNLRQLQLHFLNLRGAVVSAKILCGCSHQAKKDDKDYKHEELKIIKKKGKITTAGRDFLQINPTGSYLFILYEKLHSISRSEDIMMEHEQEFIHADEQTRRKLTLQFGEFVAKNNELVNLFFGVPLLVYLKDFKGHDVVVRTNDGKVKGILTEIDGDQITLLNKMDRVEVNLRDICYLKVVNVKE